ncbi:hypothetical protein AB6A40_009980 [Gnathostoma spinigerum]|uniref:Uncharacterized protein n=1 Tax=Gnathostoma spinigerum TaxID=75299 RepID=A0ABD6ETT7_9BILA
MPEEEAVDDENPPFSPPEKRFGITVNPDPAFPITVASVITNIILSNMLVYGLSGSWRAGLLAAAFTVPVSCYLCVKDAEEDYHHWKEMESLRKRGIPARFMPLKTKYDWSDYEKYMRFSDRTSV